MILREGDSIKLVKPIPMFNFIGSIFTITKLTTEGSITMENPKLGLCIMNYNAFALFFEKCEAAEVKEKTPPKRVWSSWAERFHPQLGHLMFRENGKRLTVKRRSGSIQAHATCHSSDTFDIGKGFTLAAARLQVKEMQKAVADIKAGM